MVLSVDIGVFAHNEAAGIEQMLARLAKQDILQRLDISVRMLVLANGCRDDTVARARAAGFGGIDVIDMPEAGKSRTWNRFVHDLARPEADILIFVDADIEFGAEDILSRLAQGLQDLPSLWVLNSQPVKDLVARPGKRKAIEKLIAGAGGGLDDWKLAVCGQLYAMPAHRARRFHLPIGLPVEDGFLRAMVLTDTFTRAEDFSRIDGLDGLFHIYASERTVTALIRHQTRIVIGSAINFACFDWLARLPEARRVPELARVSQQDGWLAQMLHDTLPRFPFGYVPFHFLGKRLARLRGGDFLRPKRLMVAFIGFGFDVIVYLRAQVAMFRGAGAGFW